MRTAYIADVIAKIAGGWPASRWDKLMLWNWAAGEQPLIAEAAKGRPAGHAYDEVAQLTEGRASAQRSKSSRLIGEPHDR